MQLSGELGAPKQYKSVFDGIPKILKSEGAGALYKGLAPALLRQAVYGTLRYGLYSPIKGALGAEGIPKSEIPFATKLAAGITSGSLAQFIASPTDLVKVRMQAAGMAGRENAVKYNGIVDAFGKIIRNEGFTAMWKGAVPTASRAAVLCGTELATYDEFKCWFLKQGFENDWRAHTAAALTAGFLSTLASSPFDVVKSRVMSQPFDAVTGKGLQYSSMIDCFGKSIKSEGPMFMLKGFGPNYARIGPRVLIVFQVLEALRERFD